MKKIAHKTKKIDKITDESTIDWQIDDVLDDLGYEKGASMTLKSSSFCHVNEKDKDFSGNIVLSSYFLLTVIAEYEEE